MPANERLDAKCGPFGNLWQAYANALDGLARSCEPAAVGIGRWQLELMALGLRRTQAWLEIPARLGQCRAPQDLFGEQLRFWQTASAHYSEGGQRLLATALSVVPPTAASGRREGGRDFIAVSQAREPAPAPAKDREAA
jgi:hypothetical protein